MEIRHTQPNHEDARGEIRDILTHDEVDAVTFLTINAGSVRGNHYHEKSVQWDYVLSGSIECYCRIGLDGQVEKVVIGPGDLVKHPVEECHALKALEDSSLLSLTKGPRRGEDYEDDVVRLTEPLVS